MAAGICINSLSRHATRGIGAQE
ncbi:MAG: hypothetical protein RL175_1433, partial [Pseudomonadota bacterium]